MNLLLRLIFLVLLVLWSVHCVEFEIICRKNCAKASQIDASKEIEVVGECIEGCTQSITYLWQLESRPKNIRQSFDLGDTLGFNTSFLTILPNVLKCGEDYDLTLTVRYSGGNKVYVVGISMAKCSRKYPPGEEDDETQFENDYSDFDYVQPSEEELALSQSKLWEKIDDAIIALKKMYNKSSSFSIPKKKVEILKLIELTKDTATDEYMKAIYKAIRIGQYGPVYLPSVVRKVLQVGLVLINRAIESLNYPLPLNDFASVIPGTFDLLRASDDMWDTQLHHLTDHRPTPTELPGDDFDPPGETTEYPDYNDFDLTYRKRKAIIEQIRFQQIDILKLMAVLRTRCNRNSDYTYFPSPAGKVRTRTNPIPDKIEISGKIVHMSWELRNETKDLLNETQGVALLSLEDNLLWKRGAGKEYTAAYFAMGSRRNPFILKSVANPYNWDLEFKFGSLARVDGNFLYDYPINDDCLGVHQLFVDLPMTAMVVRVEDVDDDDILKLVVLLGRRPTVKDFYENGTSVFVHDTYATIVQIKAAPGSKIYVALMPKEEDLEDSRRSLRYYKYKLVLARLQCDYIDEQTRAIDSKSCNVSESLKEDRFCCFCHKLGLHQFSQIQMRSTFLKRRREAVPRPPLNFVPTISLGVVAFVYIVALSSKKINKRSHVIVKRAQHLMDNNLLDEFEYVVVVSTGSSTTANIAFQLHGSLGSTSPHLFRGQSEPVLQSKVEDWFYLLTDKDLGDLQSIDLWSDCYGFQPSWFCSKIKVINQKSNQEWIFHINDWFTPIGRETFKTIKIENPEQVYLFDRHVYAVKALANHLWIKSFTKLQSPVFTFNERITIILSIFTTNMMLTMILLRFSHYSFRLWHFGYVAYEFGTLEVLSACISGLSTFCFTALLIYFFSNSESFGLTTKSKTRHSTAWRILSWVFLVFLLIGSAGIVAGFGLFTGFVTSIVWLYTSLLGVLVCIILECFRVMVIGCISRKADRKVLTIDYESIKIQRDKITRGLGTSGMRFLLQKYYSKLSEEEVKEKEVFARRVKTLRFEKSEFIIFVIYMCILFVNIIYERDSLSYVSANNIRDIFIDDKFIRKIELSEINSQKRFYRYMRQVFLPAIHTTNWYGSYGSSAPGRLIDFNSKMIGVARIRQTRVRNDTCKVPKSFRHFVSECHEEYNAFVQDTGKYDEFWAPFNASKEKLDSDESWYFKEWWKMKAVPFIGELAVYPGGGYTMKFGRTWSNSRIIIRYIKNTNWINQRTRAIFLDVNFYNVNDNLFNFLTIAIEQSATGAFITNYQLNTLRFLYHDQIISRILPFLWLFLSIFLLTFSWSKYYQYKEFYASNCRQFVADFWNLVDILIILLIFCLLVIVAIRFAIIESIQKEMNLSNSDFISYYDIILSQKAIEVISAFLITFSTIRLWKLLRFLRQFRLFELTLVFSAKYLISMMVINVLLITVYAGVGFLLLGPYVREFRTIWSSFVALMLISFGMEFNLGLDTTHQTMYSYVGYIYFAGYLILVLVLLNIFITIIVVGYTNAKEYFNHQPPVKYNILAFLKDDWAYNRSKYKGRLRNRMILQETNQKLREFRLRAGQDALTPKIDAYSTKIINNAQSMLQMHQLSDKTITLIQEKYRYTISERHEQTLKVLGHYYHRFSDETPLKTTLYDEYLVVVDENQENVYCSMRRQNAIKSIVEYLLSRKESKDPASIEQTKKLIEGQMNDIITMRKTSEEMIPTLERLLLEGCRSKSTQVTFSDLGIELSSSPSPAESSDDIDMEFQSGNLTIYLKV